MFTRNLGAIFRVHDLVLSSHLLLNYFPIQFPTKIESPQRPSRSLTERHFFCTSNNLFFLSPLSSANDPWLPIALANVKSSSYVIGGDFYICSSKGLTTTPFFPAESGVWMRDSYLEKVRVATGTCIQHS